MTEQEWLTCANPQRMLLALGFDPWPSPTPVQITGYIGKAGRRKLRLWASACREAAYPGSDWNKSELKLRRFVTAWWGSSESQQSKERLPLNKRADLLREVMGNPPVRLPGFCEPCSGAGRVYYCELLDVGNSEGATGLSVEGLPVERECPDCSGSGRNASGISWLSDATARGVAKAIYRGRDWAELPVLADALEDAGCTHESVLGHLRAGGVHVRGCWALDVVMGRG